MRECLSWAEILQKRVHRSDLTTGATTRGNPGAGGRGAPTSDVGRVTSPASPLSPYSAAP